MAKIKLGARPKSFKKTVTFPMLDGTEGTIVCEFKYRTKKEFGQFIDRIFKDAGDDSTVADAATLASVMSKTVDKNADYLAEILDSWDLDEKLSRDNLVQLCDEVPAAAAAVMEAYRIATVEGRLGN